MVIFRNLGRLALAVGASVMLSTTLPVLAEQPAHGGTLVMGANQVPRHLNGAVQSGSATAMPSTQLFASLLRYDDQWNPQPYLAESWEWSDDGLSFTAHLRKNAVFHDGTPITSEDVAFSIETIKENHPFKTMFGAVDRVETPDPHTAVFRLSAPHPALMIALSPALSPILPKHIYGDGQDVKNHPANVKGVVGSGPFKLARFVPGKEIVLERFDQFFLKDRPYLDRIVMQVNEDEMTLALALDRGDIDLLPFVGDPTTLRQAKANPAISIIDRGYEGVGAEAWLGINTARKPFDDKRVRQAIAYSLDDDFIVKALLFGYSESIDGPIIPSSPFYAPASIHKYGYDLDKARALLDEAGLAPGKDGVRFNLTLAPQPGIPAAISKNMAEYVRAQLKKVGITVRLAESADFPAWAALVANHDFDMITDTVWNWGDPVIGVHRTYLSSNIRNAVWTNTQSYRNAKVDELLDLAGKEANVEKRKALYAQFQDIVTDELPIIYTVRTPYHTLATQRVGNVPTTIWGALSPLDEVYLK